MTTTRVKPNLWLMYEGKGENFGVRLSEGGRALFDELPGGPTDQTCEAYDILGNLWEIWREACGLGCFCAAGGSVIKSASST